MKLLIVKLSSLGDVVLSLPFACAVRDQSPGAVIHWVVEEPAAPLLLAHPALDRVWLSPRGAARREPARALGHIARFIRQLRATTYDAVVDLQGLIKSAMVVAASKGERKIGFKGGKEPAAAWALNQAQPPYDPDRHALSRYLDLLQPLGLERPARPRFGLEPAEAQLAAARKALAGGGAGRPLVVCHPAALWESKLWPLPHWQSLVKRLLDQGLAVAITGSAADAESAAAIVDGLGKGAPALNLCGQTDLPTLAALLTLAKLVICTDTGVMHLAAGVGAPTLALFGPTAPWRTGPWGQEDRVMRLGLTCSPCFKRQCPDPRCMRELSPLAVARRAADMLAQGQRPGDMGAEV